MMNNAQAASEQEQIQQLRDEVKELRALLEQYVPQSKQKIMYRSTIPSDLLLLLQYPLKIFHLILRWLLKNRL